MCSVTKTTVHNCAAGGSMVCSTDNNYRKVPNSGACHYYFNLSLGPATIRTPPLFGPPALYGHFTVCTLFEPQYSTKRMHACVCVGGSTSEQPILLWSNEGK